MTGIAELVPLTKDALLGAWRMTSWTYEIVGTDEKRIEMVDHPVGFDGIGSGVSKHRVVKRELLLGSRHKSNRFFAITFQNKHHHALGTIDNPAAGVGA
jgi:hypothetical protein